MNRTQIEWARNPDGSPGYTWNPITGCLNHDNGLCKGGGFPCYAYKLANGRLKPLYLANKNVAPRKLGTLILPRYDPFYPRFWEERMSCQFSTPPAYSGRFSQQVRLALRLKHRKGIFVCDMSDLFGIGIPENWTWQVMQLIKAYPEHRFYLLTKQPQNLIKFSPFPENCFVGVTATDYTYTDRAIHFLSQIKAKVKYISFEPLLFWATTTGQKYEWLRQLDWLIIGACTGTRLEMSELINRYGLKYETSLTIMQYGNKWTAQPRIEWVREIVEAADKAGVKVFLKDNLKPLKLKYPIEYKWAFTEDRGAYFFRQELPNQEDNG